MKDEFINQCLEIKRGDTKTYTLYFVDENNNPVSIVGWTIFFTAKNKPSDSDDDAIIKKTVTSHLDAINGKTQISFTSLDTAVVTNLMFDIQVKTDVGDIKTILEGNLSITQDITLRTA